MCMQCFWGFEAGVAALSILRYRHVRHTVHRDLFFELEEEEDWFAPRGQTVEAAVEPAVDTVADDASTAGEDQLLLDA